MCTGGPSGAASFVGPPVPKPGAGYLSANLSITAGDKDEVVYGLGQGNWTNEGGCPAAGLAGSRIVPLERNGQTVDLQQVCSRIKQQQQSNVLFVVCKRIIAPLIVLLLLLDIRD